MEKFNHVIIKKREEFTAEWHSKTNVNQKRSFQDRRFEHKLVYEDNSQNLMQWYQVYKVIILKCQFQFI
jgi:hypothetical protein